MRRVFFLLALVILAAGLIWRKSVAFYLHFVPYYLAGPAPKADCGEGRGLRYCVHEPPPGSREDPEAVLYFLHYAGGSEKTWSEIPVSRVFYAEFKRRGLAAPRVVTVSYGPYWNLFDKPGPKSPALYPAFVGEAMPWLEARLGGPKRRYLWGMSQGGLNASLLVLKSPGLWSGAVFSCPGWYTVSVFAGEEEVAEFVRRTGAKRETAQWGMGLIRDRVAGPEEWAREDPLARAASARDLPPVLIDCTDEDGFGFFEGAARMAETLRRRGQEVSFLREKGRHCQLDARRAAGFLAELLERPKARASARRS